MAANTKKTSTGNKRNSSGKSTSGKSTSSRSTSKNAGSISYESEPLFSPMTILLLCTAMGILLFLSNFNLFGVVGKALSSILFGLFGLPQYVLPLLFIVFVLFTLRARTDNVIKRKVIASTFMYCILCMLIELVSGAVKVMEDYDLKLIWETGAEDRLGGGIIFSSLTFFLSSAISRLGTVVLLIVLFVICLLIFLGRESVEALRDGTKAFADSSIEEMAARKHAYDERKLADNTETVFDEAIPRYARKRKGIGYGLGMDPSAAEDADANKRIKQVEGEPLPDMSKVKRADKKVSGVMPYPDININDPKDPSIVKNRDDIHEITINDIDNGEVVHNKTHADAVSVFDNMEEITFGRGGMEDEGSMEDEPVIEKKPSARVSSGAPVKKRAVKPESPEEVPVTRTPVIRSSRSSGAYKMPTLDLLNKMKSSDGSSSKDELLKTAALLQNTLENFGVSAKVTDISQGPSVTRFELKPEVGVRVNKIVSLTDDIKLSLGAADIRIEAPIPGKSAVGIEVPNREATGVGLRELLEDRAFKEFDSKLAIAVGKDIAGKTIVADIAKMPHMLIAGSTGSGKSVCINTIIMSILYKAHPDEVKLIMVDPKVVELSVYNGIPHLLIPVVTDPKKAAAALNWGVAEMTERYKKFAEQNVRDLKGYNAKIREVIASGRTTDDDGNELHPLPQIVIIVDELADLMMVAAKEVEESICRIAQLARACGIHLIIATQRPSVDVITGLIKANMPSRVAFAVSSGVDSRTILDMNGAEKLLGKGDMLFFPQGYNKPARVQGAFVSDGEVSKVVDFLKAQDYVGIDMSSVENKISSIGSGSSSSDASGSSDDIDDLFVNAGRFIIESDKASIGSLQRKFKIGFNRAARIMDQLAEAGVVSEENGTKPREILMSPEQFENYIEG